MNYENNKKPDFKYGTESYIKTRKILLKTRKKNTDNLKSQSQATRAEAVALSYFQLGGRTALVLQ